MMMRNEANHKTRETFPMTTTNKVVFFPRKIRKKKESKEEEEDRGGTLSDDKKEKKEKKLSLRSLSLFSRCCQKLTKSSSSSSSFHHHRTYYALFFFPHKNYADERKKTSERRVETSTRTTRTSESDARRFRGRSRDFEENTSVFVGFAIFFRAETSPPNKRENEMQSLTQSSIVGRHGIVVKKNVRSSPTSRRTRGTAFRVKAEETSTSGTFSSRFEVISRVSDADPMTFGAARTRAKEKISLGQLRSVVSTRIRIRV